MNTIEKENKGIMQRKTIYKQIHKNIFDLNIYISINDKRN